MRNTFVNSFPRLSYDLAFSRAPISEVTLNYEPQPLKIN